MGRPAFQATDAQRALVLEHRNLPHRAIAAMVGCSVSTLRKTFAPELAAPVSPELFDAPRQNAPARVSAAKRGRKVAAHSAEAAARVEQYVALGMSVADIARAMALSEPTLRKLYAEALAVGASRTRAALIDALMRAAKRGNVAAQREGLRLVEQAGLDRLQQAAAAGPRDEAPGKKAQAQIDAARALEEDGWGSLIRQH